VHADLREDLDDVVELAVDREFDDIIQVLAEVGVHKLSVRAILKVLKETKPELVAKFAEFI